MKIFWAGATGAIGRQLLPMLVSAGHTVTATTQHPDKMKSIYSAGAIPMLVNALDKAAVLAAVEKAHPEIIIHQLTAIPANLNLRHLDEGFLDPEIPGDQSSAAQRPANTTGFLLVSSSKTPRFETIAPPQNSARRVSDQG